MLNRLMLENFKAWREADLTFGKVTGFFGTNSAGKSSLLHLLLLLKQTRNATDRGIVLDFGGPGHMVNLGSARLPRAAGECIRPIRSQVPGSCGRRKGGRPERHR